jgi:predicted 3-demethylubiquinone-9 3-methyltransferase (glyoxalase superfamily)
MSTLKRISPCLWFDGRGEEAAKFYTSVFKGGKITAISRYTEAGKEIHGQQPGSVMTVAFELDGHPFTALNGGPEFKFSEAISFQVHCESQHEVDYFWDKLSAGGDEKAQVCGWLKDRFGVSWQIVPEELDDMLMDADRVKAERAMGAMMKMKKLDIAALRKAFDGK